MKSTRLINITIALAGMLQAIALIRELTQTGKMNNAAYTASMHSIFQINSANILTIYDNLAGIRLGLEKIVQTFDLTQPVDKLQQRYLLSLIHLQKKLTRTPKTLIEITDRLSKIQKQVAYFSLTHPTVIANLADLYLNTFSKFRFRIVILGNPRILQAPEPMEKVRALLLAGVRAAVLWRQMGGSRLHILFYRAKLRATAENLLKQLDETVEKDRYEFN